MTDTDTFMGADGNPFTLSDIASIPKAEVEERRFEVTPVGIYQLKCVDTKLLIKPTKNGPSPAIEFHYDITGVSVQNWKDQNGNERDTQTLIGKKFTENMYLDKKDILTSIGYVKAFMKDSGFQGVGELQEMLAAYIGTEFRTPLIHKVDPNDTDKKYPRIVQEKFSPVKPKLDPDGPRETVAA